jgi:hypothetical protein
MTQEKINEAAGFILFARTIRDQDAPFWVCRVRKLRHQNQILLAVIS